MNDFLTCEQIKSLLSPYFDMELTDEDNNLVEKHLETCSDCRQELDNIKQLSSIVKCSSLLNAESDCDKLFVAKNLLPEEITRCLKTKANLSAFIDGELDRETTVEILEHIINCHFCRNQYEKIKKTQELTRNYLKKAVFSDTFTQKRKIHLIVIEKIRQEKSRKKVLSSAAALIFTAVLSWFSFYQFNSFKSDQINIDNTKFIKTDKPMYVNSEEFVLSDLNSTPPKEMVSLLYGD
ncbi:MAG TPA: zf-HC2 domain-containing protein [Candidatus Gastranaerophilales bacterium]|nr:zf-HC2 domain-containing protein [Candidatus Gastranaerophilales bacterium]